MHIKILPWVFFVLLTVSLSLACERKEREPGYYLDCEHPVLKTEPKVWRSSEPIEFSEGAYFVGNVIVAPGALVCFTSQVRRPDHHGE